MKSITYSILISSFLISFASFATEITLTTQDNFNLKADYYQTKGKSTRGVLMLHQCNYNRSMYNNIGEQLSQHGVSSLSLDFRGFGQSVSDIYDVNKIRKLPQKERRVNWQEMSKHWSSDVKSAYDFLKNKLTPGGIIV